MAWTAPETARVKALEDKLTVVQKTLASTVGFVRFSITDSATPDRQFVAIGKFKVHIQNPATLTAMGLGRTPCLPLKSADTLAKLPELVLSAVPPLKVVFPGMTIDVEAK